jgi:DNA-binding XRE family transcriptional regulator
VVFAFGNKLFVAFCGQGSPSSLYRDTPFCSYQGVDIVQFQERLRAIRASKKQTQKALAELLDVSERAYQHYEAGTREPNIANLIALADYFGVSLDYLVGRSDDSEVR